MILVVYLRYKLLVLIILETNTKDLPVYLTNLSQYKCNTLCNNHLSPSRKQHARFHYNFLYYLRNNSLSKASATEKLRVANNLNPSKSILPLILTNTNQLIVPPIMMGKMNARYYMIQTLN